MTLLRGGKGDPAAFEVVEGGADSPYVIACDHASNRIPSELGTLGLSTDVLSTHIAWDIGIADVARRMAQTLSAYLILSNFSRLVIDCNRSPGTVQSIVTSSAGTVIPGNVGLGAEAAERRATSFFWPYHDQIEAELDRRRATGQSTLYVALHSFTPELFGARRPWHVGILYQRDSRIARCMLESLRAEPDLVVGDNEPYRVTDSSDFSVIVHGEKRALLHVELEIRQDLIVGAAGQQRWADRLCRHLAQAHSRCQ